MPRGYAYILLCEDDHLYTGSTIDLERRFLEHKEGRGANFTKSHPPIHYVYIEEFSRIDKAFNRENQIQKWRRLKKIALIDKNFKKLKELSVPYRDLKIGKV